MAEKIQADHEGLNVLAGQIREQGDRVQEIFHQIQAQTGILASNWSGTGAKEFQIEMETLVLPALQRLVQALEETAQTMTRIRAHMIEAEEEAIQQLPGGLTTDGEMNFVEQWEGREHEVYLDTEGNRTIGVGFNLERAGARERIEALGLDYDQVLAGDQRLTDGQIDALLRPDVEQAMADARDLVENFDQLPHEVQEIVVDMVYNLGRDGFAGFENAIDALEQEDFARAADEMQDSLWYGQVGRRAQNHVETVRNLAAQHH